MGYKDEASNLFAKPKKQYIFYERLTTGERTQPKTPKRLVIESAKEFELPNQIPATEKKELQCLDCDATYFIDQNHRCHTTKLCSICNLKMDSQKHLVLHFKENHVTDRTCQICNIELSSAATLHFHIRTHQEGLSYICDVCGKVMHF